MRLAQALGTVERADDDRDAVHRSAGRVAVTSHSRQSPFWRPFATTVRVDEPALLEQRDSVAGVNPVKWKSPAYSWPPYATLRSVSNGILPFAYAFVIASMSGTTARNVPPGLSRPTQ